jgi:hypothetical protein
LAVRRKPSAKLPALEIKSPQEFLPATARDYSMQLRAGCKARDHSRFVYLLSQWAAKGKNNSRLF